MDTYDFPGLPRALLDTSGRALSSLARFLILSLVRVLPSSLLMGLACMLGRQLAS